MENWHTGWGNASSATPQGRYSTLSVGRLLLLAVFFHGIGRLLQVECNVCPCFPAPHVWTQWVTNFFHGAGQHVDALAIVHIGARLCWAKGSRERRANITLASKRMRWPKRRYIRHTSGARPTHVPSGLWPVRTPEAPCNDLSKSANCS